MDTNTKAPIRMDVMDWWNGLRLTERVVAMNKFGIAPYKSSDSLTYKEIESLYNNNNNK